MSLRTKARVTVTLEFDVNSTWGADCTLEQLHKQAADDAKAIVMQGVSLNGLKNALAVGDTPAKILSMEIDAIITGKRESR